jgi:hypothetical protein
MKIQNVSSPLLTLMCPGCGQYHELDPLETSPGGNQRWMFNGNYEKPTITPSILTTYPRNGTTDYKCNAQITDGKITYSKDSTHLLAGVTVDLPDI